MATTELLNEATAIGPWPWFAGLAGAGILGWLVPMSARLSFAAGLVLLIVVLAGLFPKAALYGMFVVLITEGAVRKWILPGAQDLIYFGKDVVLMGLYSGVLFRGLFVSRQPVPLPRGVQVLMYFVVMYLCTEFFNPRNPSFILSGFGLRNYIFYMGLMFAVPPLFSGRSALYKFLKIQMILVIPVCILGIVQFFSPVDHWLNQYANVHHNLDIASFGSSEQTRARITGTFSYITGYTSWLTVMIVMVLPFFLVSGQKERRLYAVPLSFLAGNLLMTGSRGPVLLVLMSIPVFVWGVMLGFRSGPEAELVRKRVVVRLVGGFLLVGFLLATVFRDPLEGLVHRTQVIQDQGSRLDALIVEPFRWIPDSGIFGWGMGTTHQARDVLLQKSGDWGRMPTQTEEEPIRIMQELGVAGFILWYLLRIILIFWVIYRFKVEKDAFFRLILLTVLLVQLAALPISMVLNHTMLFLYWFSLGMVRVPIRYTESQVVRVRKRK